MFDRGVNALLAKLPEIGGLDPPVVRRLLTAAFLDVVATRDLLAEAVPDPHVADLRRLATALELHAVLAQDLPDDTVRACAFVAAEALEVHHELASAGLSSENGSIAGVPTAALIAVEAAALYFVAGFDANAAVATRALADVPIDPELPERAAVEDALAAIRAYFELRARTINRIEPPPDDLPLVAQIRWELWRRLGQAVDGEVGWLRMRNDEGARAPMRAAAELTELAGRVAQSERHSDIHHLLDLLALAVNRASTRALRDVIPEADASEIWNQYVQQRVRDGRPLLWPAASEYAQLALPELDVHAVVAVPTGAGKTAVAELAIARALSEGWVLYLAPTNALVGQVLRDMEARFSSNEDVTVRGFLGGGEYTEFQGELLEDVATHQLLVMTPEKCSLALRQHPEVFASLRLFVMDECHLLADPGSRGVVAELVVAELASRSSAVALLLSALVENADELAAWLRSATEREAVAIVDPWRPTRTLRAVVGIEPDGANAAFAEAVAYLEENERRKELTFEAPVSLLANLQGAWETTDPSDYQIVGTRLTAQLTARKGNDGRVRPERGRYVNEMTARLTTELARRGHRVLAFLPANKHHSFSVARDLDPLPARPRGNARLDEIDALLDLADYELGLPTVLRDLLASGVGVHTSAMLRDEQRASELAFMDGQAVALFATTTLAQGLNLPATAVVLGGTRVGHDPQIPYQLRDERARAQLLNAIGRAGRAFVASRSLGIVVPDHWVVFRAEGSISQARDAAPFLAREDASTQVRSQLERLIEQALTGEGVSVEAMSEQEQTAFSFLSMADEGERSAVVRHSFGAYRAGITRDDERAERVAVALEAAGDAFLAAADAPPSIAVASHLAGVALPPAASLFRISSRLVGDGEPRTVDQWRLLLVNSIRDVSPALTELALPRLPFSSTRIEPLFDAQVDTESRVAAAAALESTTDAWIRGETLTEIAGLAIGPQVVGNPARGSGNPLPKVIALVDNGIAFGLSRAAGLLAAFAEVMSDADDPGPWQLTPDSRAALDLLPLSLRFGADDLPAVAWYRWGVRRRRLAHLLAGAIPPPQDLDASELPAWIGRQRRMLIEDADVLPDLGDADARAVMAYRVVGRRGY